MDDFVTKLLAQLMVALAELGLVWLVYNRRARPATVA
jgi:hypothetical protein